MTTIDDKVVAMSFESSKFESGVHSTIDALDKLKKSLVFPDAGKGLENINEAAKRVDLSHIARGVEGIQAKLGALSVAALAIFANIAAKAAAAAGKMLKAFSLDPLIAGFHEYATNLNAIQTILANTQAAGATLGDVNEALQNLNRYSDRTIYNFSQMARNIGTFTAAGVDLDTAVGAIKGIANLAALSGSSAEQAATAMYQLSQAISSGRVSLQDWNSVVNAGMGGTVFQRALAQTAEAMGTLSKGSVELKGKMKNVSIEGKSFRESIQAGPGKTSWLTSKVLTETLKQFTGDLSDAQLAAMGFNEEQIKAIQTTAKTAQKAATEVKTLSQVLDVAKETAGSGWAQTWQIVFGNFGEAKATFTALSNAINGFINANAQARNKVLADWKKLGGRTILIDSIKTAFHNLGLILRPIRKAFRDIFPRTTGRDLLALTKRFQAFTRMLKPSPETVNNLRRTFRGLFALLDIGKQVISGIFRMFGRLFNAVGAGDGKFLNFTGNIGDFLVKLDESLKKGGKLEKFFERLGDSISKPIKYLKSMKGDLGGISDLFDKFPSGGFSLKMGGLTKSLEPFQKILESISSSSEGLGPAISKALSGMNFDAILQVIRTGLLGAIVVMLKSFFGRGSFVDQLGKGLGGGFLKNIGESMGALTGSLKAMQTNIRAKTLKEIAIAIGILAIAILALSLVKPERLKSSMVAITVAMGELLGAMKIMDKVTSSTGFIKLPLVAGSLILLATAIDVLVIAVTAMSKLGWEELAKGLAGVGALLGGLSAATAPLSKNSAGMIRAGIGITAIAVAMKILASAVADFGKMNLQTLGKGLGSVAVGMGVIGGAMRLMPKGMILTGAGLVLVATSMKIMAGAIGDLGAMDLRTLGTGIGAIAVALSLIGLAMKLMPLSMVATAFGLVQVAKALNNISNAVVKMGGLSIREIAKGLITLGGSLAILAGGVHLMGGTFADSTALFVMAAGISLLAGALAKMAKLSWGEIIKSLVVLASTMGVLALASVALSEAIPAMLAFGAAMFLIGAGLFLAGAGVALVGLGLSEIAIAGPTAIGILINALDDLVNGMIEAGKNLIIGLVEIGAAFAKASPALVDSLVKIVNSLLDVVIRTAPKFGEAITALIHTILGVFSANRVGIIQAGIDLLISLLKGIRDNISKVVGIVGDIISRFLTAIANNLQKIIDAGVDILVNLIEGIGKNATKIFNAGVDAMARFIRGVASKIVDLVDAGADAIIKFLNGVADVIEKREPQLLKAGVNIGTAIIKGMIKGIGNEASDLYKKIKEVGKKALDYVKHPWKILSPSRTMYEIGQFIVQGLADGLSDNEKAMRAAKEMGKIVIRTFNEIFETASPSKVTYDIGRYVTQGFANGIRHGTRDEVKSAFGDLNKQLTDAMAEAKKNSDAAQFKLVDLLTAKKQDPKAIKETTKAITDNEEILRRTTATHATLVKTLWDEQANLQLLAKTYTQVSEKLKKARDVLKEAKATRDDAIKGFTDQYSALPDIVTGDVEDKSADQLGAYMTALTNQTLAVAAYRKTLDQLRKLGLDDKTYQKLLEEGTADQQFADQLLEGGKTAVQGLNQLDRNLDNESKKLGTSAGKNLYQSGVDAAQGFVDGLRAQKQQLREVINEIATDVVDTLNKKLKSKSPSQEFAEVGKYAMQGLAKGMIDSSKLVTNAVYMVADDAMGAVSSSISRIGDLVSSQIDSSPTITPILDLSQVQNGSKILSSILTPAPLATTALVGAASAIPSGQVVEEDGVAVAPGGTSIKFEQNNYSPESLSTIDIYRKTKNQLSQLRSMAHGPVIA